MGHFVLRDTDYSKVFIGTGTGFAPLYFMIKSLLSKSTKQETCQEGMPSTQSKKQEVFFLFGVRELRDVFYQDQLEGWSKNSSFDYEIYCSREDSILSEKHHQGRVTDYLKNSFVLPSPPVKGHIGVYKPPCQGGCPQDGGFYESTNPPIEN